MPPAVGTYTSQKARQFITSGAADEKVPDVSIFRKYFVDGLKGGADLNSYGYFTASDLFFYLRGRVANEAAARGKEQHPQFDRYSGLANSKGDMVFAPTAAIKLTDEQAWEKAERERTPTAYTQFIIAYPTSRHASEAQARKAELEKPLMPAPASVPLADAKPSANKPLGAIKKQNFAFSTVITNQLGGVKESNPKTNDAVNIDLGDGVEILLVKAPKGTFKMGSDARAQSAPVHDVSLDDFYVGAYEISRKQWKTVALLPQVNRELNPNPARVEGGDDLPVTGVSWEDAEEFCARLQVLFPGKRFELPTESEWEYAARGGTTGTPFSFGPQIGPEIVNVRPPRAPGAVIDPPARDLLPIGWGKANPWGLFNIHGNAAEWCRDQWTADYNDKRQPDMTRRVLRGGSRESMPDDACVSCRAPVTQTMRLPTIGFRIVLESQIN